MQNIIGLKEFRAEVPKIINKAAKGESFIVIKRSKPVLRVTGVEDEDWETIIDFTKIKKGGVDIKDIIKRL